VSHDFVQYGPTHILCILNIKTTISALQITLHVTIVEFQIIRLKNYNYDIKLK